MPAVQISAYAAGVAINQVFSRTFSDSPGARYKYLQTHLDEFGFRRQSLGLAALPAVFRGLGGGLWPTIT